MMLLAGSTILDFIPLFLEFFVVMSPSPFLLARASFCAHFLICCIPFSTDKLDLAVAEINAS
jgi:hypothetical protein